MGRRVTLILFFELAFFLFPSWAEEVDLPFVLIMPPFYEDKVQEQSHTIWEGREYIFPPLNNEETTGPQDGSQNIPDMSGEELSQVWEPEGLSFADPGFEIPWYLISIPYEVLGIDCFISFPEPASFQSEHNIPIALKIIDKDEKAVRLTLGNENLATLNFIVKPDGIYDLGGSFEGPEFEFEWRGERYTITVFEEDGKLKINIAPHSYSPFTIGYSRDFLLGGYSGEIKVGISNGLPVFEIELDGEEEDGEEEEDVLDLKVNPEDVSLAMNVKIKTSKEGVGIKVDSLKIEESELNGEGSLTFERDGQVLVLSYSLGENPSLEIAQDKSLDQIIDEFIAEVAEVVFRSEFGGCPDAEVPPWLIDDIKLYFYRLFGDNKLELVKLIEEINEKRQGLTIPTSLRIYMEFSSQGDRELVLPILPGIYALRWVKKDGDDEISFLSALDNSRNIEIGYRGDDNLIFRIADFQTRSVLGFEFSASGIEAFNWNLRDLEGRFYRTGFSFGSSEVYLGSLWDLFQQDPDAMEWKLGYDITAGWRLNFKLPLDDFLHPDSYLSLGWEGGRISFGFKLPFIFDGILEVNPRSFKYTLRNKDIRLDIKGGNNRLEMQFQIPPPKEKEEKEG